MGYLGRRIGLSQDQGDSNPGAAGGAVGGGLLDLFAHGYFERQGDLYNAPGAGPLGLTATGGIISDYAIGPGDVYRAHIFTSSGALNVTAIGDFGDTVDYLVVGGGGAGGGWVGGGGGAGLLKYGSSTVTSPSPYAVIIGAGGNAKSGSTGDQRGDAGGTSSIAFSTPISCVGGGAGGAYGNGPSGSPVVNGPTAGGSGGGGGSANSGTSSGAGSPGVGDVHQHRHPGAVNQPSPSNGWGSDGGAGYPGNSTYGGGGGGGAGGNGGNSPGPTGGVGGTGAPYSITGTTTYYAGGGGGVGGTPPGTGPAGNGGGGRGGAGPSPNTAAISATASTGGGGGGARDSGIAGSGGSGIVVVRYQIGSINTPGIKATGGAVSFYGGKTIHAFTNTGDFNNTSGGNLTGCEVIILGGGGGGNVWQGGGGGAGRFYRNDDVTLAPGPQAVTIGSGGAGGRGRPAPGIPVAPSGSQSVFNSVTMPGGGGGGLYDVAGAAGGSGGGGSYGSGGPGTASPGNVVASTNVDTPSNGAGNAGGGGASPQGAGGGGGAGAVGTSSPNSDKKGGSGGAGVQLPSTFRDPISTVGYPGPSSALHFVGGGGGGSSGPPNFDGGGGGGAPQVPSTYQGTSMTIAQALNYEWAGAGSGVQDTGPSATSARSNSGSGGGGTGSGAGNKTILGGNGGSGLVLIAYPS